MQNTEHIARLRHRAEVERAYGLTNTANATDNLANAFEVAQKKEPAPMQTMTTYTGPDLTETAQFIIYLLEHPQTPPNADTMESLNAYATWLLNEDADHPVREKLCAMLDAIDPLG